MKARVYTTPTCPWCIRTKKLPDDRGVEYEEANVAEDAREVVEKSRQRGVPVTVIGDEVIVGFNRERFKRAIA